MADDEDPFVGCVVDTWAFDGLKAFDAASYQASFDQEPRGIHLLPYEASQCEERLDSEDACQGEAQYCVSETLAVCESLESFGSGSSCEA